MKSSLFLIILLAVLSISCGEKSIVKAKYEPKKMGELFGDGESITVPLTLALSDHSIDEVEGPVAGVNVLARGLARMIGNLATMIGMGKGQVTVIQPLPEIPTDIIQSLKVKRVFFYIEPQAGNKRRYPFYQRWLLGKGEAVFIFIDRLVLRLSSVSVETKKMEPIHDIKTLSRKDDSILNQIFDSRFLDMYKNTDPQNRNEIYLLSYRDKKTQRYLRSNHSKMTYIIKSDRPAEVKRFLYKNPELRSYIDNAVMLNKTLVLEFPNNPIVEEIIVSLIEDQDSLVKDLKITWIEQCEKDTCLDLKVEETNLLPLLTKGNAVKLDAFFDTNYIPDGFQLRGFIEFEGKIKLSF